MVINVLIVENNPTILKLLSHHLEAEGCQVRSVANGLEALVKLDKEIPDIIFTDIIMPKVSGDQLCTIIRNNNKLRDIFIAVHSSTSLEDNRQILEMDADIYIAKGPKTNLKDHVHHVLDQYQKGIRRNPKTYGGNTLHPREITRELLLERKHHQAIFNNVAEAIVELDSTGQIVQANMAAQRLFGKGSLEILSSQFVDFLEGREKKNVIRWIDHIAADGPSVFRSSFSPPLRVNKRKILLNLVAVVEAQDFFIIGILQDITLQKNTEDKLAQTLGEFNAVIDTIDYGVLLLDSKLRVRIANQAYMDLWQMPQSFVDTRPTMREIIEYTSSSGIYYVAPENIQEYIEQRLNAIHQGDIQPTEMHRTDGRVLQYRCTVLPDNGRLLTFFDITGLKNTEQKLEAALEKVSDLANHDPLTGLPNLRLARENLHGAIALAKRKEWMAALMFIDLDGFKEVNDSHGHEIGDMVLKMVGERLTESLRETDTVARIGGDEFLVIQTEVHDRSDITKVAEKIVKRIAEPFYLEEIEIKIGASIGIAVYPQNGEESRVLMKKADDALYYTKRIGKNNYAFTPG
jgi:diguanylate cyclase (GGDEF)-like protein/PAS domain S-box-containing protein